MWRAKLEEKEVHAINCTHLQFLDYHHSSALSYFVIFRRRSYKLPSSGKLDALSKSAHPRVDRVTLLFEFPAQVPKIL